LAAFSTKPLSHQCLLPDRRSQYAGAIPRSEFLQVSFEIDNTNVSNNSKILDVYNFEACRSGVPLSFCSPLCTEGNTPDDDGLLNSGAIKRLGDIVIKIYETKTTGKMVPRDYITQCAEMEIHERSKKGMAHCMR